MAENKNKKEGARFFSGKYSSYTDTERQTQKRFIIALVFVTLIALGGGGWYIAYQLRNPFAPVVSENSNLFAAGSNTSATLGGLDELRNKDTDSDGLSDYDEFYIYKTSPYLADSDSDDIPDKTEIDAGTDPNCPTGKNCNRATLANNANADTNAVLGPIQTNTATGTGGELTADELRQILRDAGASEELLSQIPDEELLATYREIQTDRGETTTTNVNDGTTTNAANANGTVINTNIDTSNNEVVTYEVLQGLTPSEIRQFLIESGVPEDTLSDIDDDTLQQIFQQSLDQYVADSTGG